MVMVTFDFLSIQETFLIWQNLGEADMEVQVFFQHLLPGLVRSDVLYYVYCIKRLIMMMR